MLSLNRLPFDIQLQCLSLVGVFNSNVWKPNQDNKSNATQRKKREEKELKKKLKTEI